MFIQLTPTPGKLPTRYNIFHIVSYEAGEKGSFLELSTCIGPDKAFIPVRESVEEIDKQVAAAIGGCSIRNTWVV